MECLRYSTAELEPKIHDKCGLFAVYSPFPDKLFGLSYYGGNGINHRGQNGAGLALSENGIIPVVYTGPGLIADVLTKEAVEKENLDRPAIWNIVHARYGTSGKYKDFNNQPCMAQSPDGTKIVCAHNGQFVAVDKMRQKAKALGINIPKGASDTYIFTQLLAHAEGETWDEKIINTLNEVDGAESLVIGIGENIYLARDRYGVRPLHIGVKKDKVIAASETLAFDMIDAKVAREVNRGEIIKISKDGAKTIKKGLEGTGAFCAFEPTYFQDPTSIVVFQDPAGKNPDIKMPNYLFRERCGTASAQRYPIDVDFVVGVPDSGIPFANGVAIGLKVPYRQVIVRNHYAPNGKGRIFMKDALMRGNPEGIKIMQKNVLEKLTFAKDPKIWEGKKVAVADDSEVRGVVSKAVTKALKELGVAEIHWYLGFMTIAYTCHLGTSTRLTGELIAARHHSNLIEMAKETGADSLTFMNGYDFLSATGQPIVTPNNEKDLFLVNGFCGGCVNGVYPVRKDGKRHNIFTFKEKTPAYV